LFRRCSKVSSKVQAIINAIRKSEDQEQNDEPHARNWEFSKKGKIWLAICMSDHAITGQAIATL
jgi:hypothetical protein